MFSSIETEGPGEERTRELRARGADIDANHSRITYSLTQITQAPFNELGDAVEV